MMWKILLLSFIINIRSRSFRVAMSDQVNTLFTHAIFFHAYGDEVLCEKRFMPSQRSSSSGSIGVI
jgi:hypothetical protein